MKPETTYLTKEKFNELSAELETLKTVRRNEIAQDLEYAKSLGDLSENAEYQEAREAQAGIEDRISKIEMMLKTAEIVSSHAKDHVTLGSLVTIKKAGAKDAQTYKIVGSEEADISKNQISFNSPLGSMLIDKKKGQEITLKTPKGVVEYSIVSIA